MILPIVRWLDAASMKHAISQHSGKTVYKVPGRGDCADRIVLAVSDKKKPDEIPKPMDLKCAAE
jgi:hypothetical protein